MSAMRSLDRDPLVAVTPLAGPRNRPARRHALAARGRRNPAPSQEVFPESVGGRVGRFGPSRSIACLRAGHQWAGRSGKAQVPDRQHCGGHCESSRERRLCHDFPQDKCLSGDFIAPLFAYPMRTRTLNCFHLSAGKGKSAGGPARPAGCAGTCLAGRCFRQRER